MTIAEVKKLKHNMPITDLRVRFVQAYERRSGAGEYGEWSFQNFKVEDETGSIIVLAKDRPEDFSKFDWAGKEIVISATEGKHGWTGAIAYDEEYQGKTQRKVKLTKSGVCKLAEEQTELEGEESPFLDDGAPQTGSTERNQAGAGLAQTMPTLYAISVAHLIGKRIYPESPSIAAAVGNTLLIAWSQKRIKDEDLKDKDKIFHIVNIFHDIGKSMYPDSHEAAAALGNTLFIAWSHGHIQFNEQHLEETLSEVVNAFHRLAKLIYPDAPEAASATGNTIFIGWSQGQIPYDDFKKLLDEEFQKMILERKRKMEKEEKEEKDDDQWLKF